MQTVNAKPNAHVADSQLNGSMIVAHEGDLQWELLTVAKRQAPNPCANVVVGWLSWNSWSTCTQTCGACGTQVRTRTCLTPIPECKCPG
ncbi:unnamed protein product [Toxocara canis]|nr:unnamed protein product [Toxocara canis]